MPRYAVTTYIALFVVATLIVLAGHCKVDAGDTSTGQPIPPGTYSCTVVYSSHAGQPVNMNFGIRTGVVMIVPGYTVAFLNMFGQTLWWDEELRAYVHPMSGATFTPEIANQQHIPKDPDGNPLALGGYTFSDGDGSGSSGYYK